MAEGAIGATFKVTRILQAACMIAIIGMTSNFVSQIVMADVTPPSVLVGILSIVCIAVLYCIITFILFLDKLLPFLIAAIVDSLFLITLIVVSVVVGKPLSYLNCNVVGKLTSLNPDATAFASALGKSLQADGVLKYGNWIGTSKSTCLEMKSIWGLCIALCILFSLSASTSMFLWKQARKSTIPRKGEA